jgi:hypothetical protein
MSKQLAICKQIRKSLKQARDLEDKIYHNARGNSWQDNAISTQELSSSITYLANQIIDNPSANFSILNMLNTLDSIKDRPLASYDKNALQIVQIVFNHLREHSSYQQEHYPILNSLQIAFIRLSLNDLSFLDSPKHPAIIFLNKVINISNYFQTDVGELVTFFTGVVKLLIDRLANNELVTSQLFSVTNTEFDKYFEALGEKISQNNRLVFHDLEKQSRVIQAKENTASLIESKTTDEELPVFLLDFIQNQVSKILKVTIETHGLQSKSCQQLLTDLDTLIWSITYPSLDDDYEYRFNADVPDAMKRIYLLFEQNDFFNLDVKNFFFEVEELHSKKLQGKRIEYDSMISANIFADESYDNHELSSWESAESDTEVEPPNLDEGQWYYLLQNDKPQRCQLLVIDKTTQQLAFVNLSGELVLKVNFEESESIMASLSPIYTEAEYNYDNALVDLENSVKAKVKRLESEYDEFMTKQRNTEEKQKQAKAIQEAERQEAREKFEREQRLKQIKQEQISRLKKERKEEEERLKGLNSEQRFGIKRIYDNLIPGVQIAHKKDNGKWQSLTLSIVSEITQRYIFVDGSGNRVFEPNKKELSELIDTLRIKIIKTAGKTTNSFQSPTPDTFKNEALRNYF